MNKLLSINYKFFKVEPQKLIEIINKNNDRNQIQGFEAAVSNSEEQQYLLGFAQKAKENNYILKDKISTEKENINVVLEYALDYMDGENFEEKMILLRIWLTLKK